MVPAVMVSALLGNTGSNSLIMALVLPLGQTALSLVMDKLWGGPSSSANFRPKPKSRSKSKSRSRSRPKARSRPRPGNGGYQSWGAAKKGGKSSSKFGGWDELDPEISSSTSFSDEQRQEVEVDALQRVYADPGKLSRTISTREKPLFIRLLIAVFPILGSWTRFFF